MSAHTVDRESQRLCLDFSNTLEWHASNHPIEKLHSYGDLVSWAQGMELLTEDDGHELRREAKRRPDKATKVLRRAIALREAIYRVFSAVAGDRLPKDSDLTILNEELARAWIRLQLTYKADNFVWGWTGGGTDLDRVLWPVARSAADLLTSEERARVGQCADDRGCGWLFLDMSRNRSRRWCDMRDCGNRAKAKRHYYRKRGRNSRQNG